MYKPQISSYLIKNTLSMNQDGKLKPGFRLVARRFTALLFSGATVSRHGRQGVW